jgi:hypothetical protein
MEIIIMAQLSSPGVSVSVTDESAYTTAPAGTIPLIFVASASNKLTDAGTGIAPGTLAENDGKVYLLSGQKDLLDTFGTPVFKTDTSNNAIHAGEQNEYGLQAAYSYLGVANRAYVARASVDLNQLNGTPVIPEGLPVDGAFWLDTVSSRWGIFEWDSAPSSGTGSSATGQTFINKKPTIITDATLVNGSVPLSGVGAVGSYAIVAVTSLIKLWYKKGQTDTAAGWVEVGSAEWVASRPTVTGTVINPTLYDTASGNILKDSITINNTTLTDFGTLAALVLKINDPSGPDGVTAAVVDDKLQLYSNSSTLNIDLTGSLPQTLSALGVSALYPYKAPELQVSSHTSVPTYKRKDAPSTVNNRPTGSLWIKTTSINLGIDVVVTKYSLANKSWLPQIVGVYANHTSALASLDSSGGGLNIAGNTIYVKSNDSEQFVDYSYTVNGSPVVKKIPTSATFKFYRRSAVTTTRIESAEIKPTDYNATYTFTLTGSLKGNAVLPAAKTVTITIAGGSSLATVVNAIASGINSANVINVHASIVGTNKIAIEHSLGGEIIFEQPTSGIITKLFSTAKTSNFYLHPTDTNSTKFTASLWSEFTTDGTSAFITPSDTEPTDGPVEGQLWYSSAIDEVDLMVNDGTKWVAFRNYDHGGVLPVDANGPFITPTKPKVQSNKTTALQEGDIWIDTSDLENYPTIYRYIDFDKQWELLDKTDHITENGIIFADARWSNDGGSEPATITSLLGGVVATGSTQEELDAAAAENVAANFVDFDAPNPALYPKGMLLWNLRRSGFNVKKYHKSYVNPLQRNVRHNDELMNEANGYVTSRWVTESGNQTDGTGSFGRKAQRKVVVQSLQALVNGNLQVRETEQRVFNLIAAPGYPELVGELKILNYDRGITAFVLADSPARLAANATDINNWGHNAKLATEDNDDGLVIADPYVAFFYPWGMASDNKGLNVVLPPTHMMLRTIALNDQISYPWFAPAGTNRGVINNIDSTGYVTSTGKYQTVSLNTGLRDTLAEIKVNPITYLDGQGIVNFGQYTRSSVSSSLDRINVARLVVYLRRQLDRATRAYLFEPNDATTRKQVKSAIEAMMVELIAKRAINDYFVQCDGQNNTPARIDRSELWIDIAIEPMKAVEFIYIPLRLKNTGEIKGIG